MIDRDSMGDTLRRRADASGEGPPARATRRRPSADRACRPEDDRRRIRPIVSPMTDRYLMISADGHAGPPAEHYRDHLEARSTGTASTNTRPSWRRCGRWPHERRRSSGKDWEAKTGDGGLRAAYDSDARNEKLDAGGRRRRGAVPRRRRARHRAGSRRRRSVRGCVLGRQRARAGVGRGQGPQPVARRLLRQGARTAASVSPSCPSSIDIDAAVAEITAVHDLGLRGVMIPTRWMTEPAYHDPRYEPVWSTLEELGMVLHTHSGAGPADYDIGPGFMAIYATEAYWWAARPLWVLLWSGVFERHPNLQYVDRRERRLVAARHRAPRWTRSTSAATTPRSSATSSGRTCR